MEAVEAEAVEEAAEVLGRHLRGEEAAEAVGRHPRGEAAEAMGRHRREEGGGGSGEGGGGGGGSPGGIGHCGPNDGVRAVPASDQGPAPSSLRARTCTS